MQWTKYLGKDYSLITLREGNIDFDRLDFVARDMFYLGQIEQRNLVNRLIKNSSIQTLVINGKKQEVVVYEYEALHDIESFLNLRASNYKKFYTSNTRKGLDILEEQFCRAFVKSDTNIGSELKEYLNECIRSGAKNIDLSKFLSWNDIKFFNELYLIAMNEKNENVRELALACMPSAEGLYSLAIEMIDPKNRKEADFTEDEKTFFKNLKDISKKENKLHNALYGTNKNEDISLNSNSKEEINSLIEDIINESEVDMREVKGIFFWKANIKKYNPEEPIYVKDRDGNIYTLDKHPELSIDLSEIDNYGVAIIPPLMRLEGVEEEKINLIKSKFEDFNKFHNIDVLPKNNRARLFKTGNKAYIPKYTEKSKELKKSFEEK